MLTKSNQAPLHRTTWGFLRLCFQVEGNVVRPFPGSITLKENAGSITGADASTYEEAEEGGAPTEKTKGEKDSFLGRREKNNKRKVKPILSNLSLVYIYIILSADTVSCLLHSLIRYRAKM